MIEIDIDKIQVKDNIRKDYGDLTELTASIKEHGVRKPLQLGADNELIDGHRRLRAAKAAGLTKVPYFYADNKIDKTTDQIIGGIFTKNLNPVEEGKAFKKQMLSEKIDSDYLAKMISKRPDYVKKRLVIADMPKEIQDELAAGKIEIGHALLLAKMPEVDAKKFCREIIRENKSVAEARDCTGGKRLSESPFDKEECKDCKYNGSKQAELFETGKILNGVCLNKGCYVKKYQEHVKILKEKYKGSIFNGSEYEMPKGYIEGDSEYNCKEHGITEAYKAKCRETKENYLVRIDDSYGRLQVREYFKAKPKKIDEKPEKQQEAQRKEVLGNKIEEFKTEWLKQQCQKTIKSGTREAKVLTLLELDGSNDPKEVFKLTEKELDKRICEQSMGALINMNMRDLLICTEQNGVDIKTQFQITKEFLELHTKAQLLDLIKELKIKTDQEYDDVKKEDLISFIMNADIKGKVPKSML